MRCVFSCLCMCVVGALSAMSSSEDEEFMRWRSSIEACHGTFTKSSSDLIGELGEEDKRRLDEWVMSGGANARLAESCDLFIKGCKLEVFCGYISSLGESASYEHFEKGKERCYDRWLRSFWNMWQVCKSNSPSWLWLAEKRAERKGRESLSPDQKFCLNLRDIWKAAGSELYRIHKKGESSLDLPFLEPLFLQNFFSRECGFVEGCYDLIGRFISEGRSSSANEIPPSEDVSEPNDQTGEGLFQDSGEVKASRRESFVEAIMKSAIGRVISINPAANFEETKRFLSDIKQLVNATAKNYAVSRGESKNRIQEFLLAKKRNNDEPCEPREISDFFRIFEPSLRDGLCEAFEDWGSTRKLKVVLLYGKPGAGKTSSSYWLFEQKKYKDMLEDVAVIKASTGDSLVGSESMPGMLDVLLLRDKYWRCISVGELSSIRDSSVGELVGRLTEDKGDIWFDSPYFGMQIPVKNVVVVCTSNSESPDDEELLEKEDRISYTKVRYGASAERYVNEIVREMYEEELEVVVPNGRDIWKSILESERESLPAAALRLRDSFDRQVKRGNLRRSAASQKVARFIAEGGEDEWLRWIEVSKK